MRVRLGEWLMETLAPGYGDDGIANRVALELHITGNVNQSATWWLLEAARKDETVFLDILDLTLAYNQTYGRSQALEQVLYPGGSVWRVNDRGDGLERRVTDEEKAAYDGAVSPADEVAAELTTAWAHAYGRNPDPSDAWDHAIKAVELALWRIVTPAKANSTLGVIVARLQDQAQRFSFRLATSSKQTTNIEALVQMLRLMWPNPDRHGTGERRTPTQEEAQNVVHLAVLLVSWVRSGALTAA
jgi:hypothetical protein